MEKLEEIRADIAEVKVGVVDIQDRLFKDNGRKSFQTRVSNLEWNFKVAATILSILAAAIATNYARRLIVPPSTIVIQDGHTVETADEN